MNSCSEVWASTARELDETLKRIYSIRSSIKRGMRDGEDHSIGLARSAVLSKLEHRIHKRLIACQAMLGHVEII